MTLRTKNTELHPVDFLEIAPSDAQQLGLQNGERVKMRSRYGEILLPVRMSAGVKPGELFATFHTPNVFVDCVTGPYRDGYVDAPEYKVTAVQIEKV
jgi:formate dehydrogenase major subunit